jgi:hypothetical protein
MATGIEVRFSQIQEGKSFADDDGVEYVKRHGRGEVERGYGYRAEGDEVDFGSDKIVTRLT